MRIGMIIGRIGGVDGVALEAEKWLAVLQRMGHETFVMAGEFEGRKPDPQREDLYPPLSFYGPECAWEQKQAFFQGDEPGEKVVQRIREQGRAIAQRIEQWVAERDLEVLVSENACALPFHLSMGVGIRRAVARLDIPTITHDHDFAWEREDRYISRHEEVNDLVAETFPLCSARSVHAVINSHAQAILRQRHDRDALVVPNVMDFDTSFGRQDDYNATVRRDLGVADDDILLFQVTRIVRRKSIETAVKLLCELNSQRIKLIITGSPNDDPGGLYAEELRTLARKLGVSQQVLFGHRVFGHQRQTRAGNKVYNLSDAYAHAAACTFFSTYEGFGNAFVEAVLARRPVFVNNYQPVYAPDIGAKGFRTVCLEDGQLTPAAVEEMRTIIHDPARAQEIAEHNFDLGRQHFSYSVLEQRLNTLLERVTR